MIDHAFANMNEPRILKAIVDDDRSEVKKMLRADPSLTTWRTEKAILYQSRILHWMYIGDTALHLAAAGHRAEIARILLDAGADPNARMNHRQSGPLHYAADTCVGNAVWNPRLQVETIRRLLDAGAEINAQDKNGATPLHRATRTRGADAVKCLLDAGADHSLKNKPGSTAFHLAVQNTGRGGSGSDEAKAAQQIIIGHFLAAGARVAAKDGNGKSVLDCATKDWMRDLLGK